MTADQPTRVGRTCHRELPNLVGKPPEWRESDDKRALILRSDGLDKAEIHRWADEKTGETAWWTAVVRGKELRDLYFTLRDAVHAICDALDIPLVLPSTKLLAEHGEEQPPATGNDAVEAPVPSDSPIDITALSEPSYEAVEAACVAYHGDESIWADQVHRSPPLASVTRDRMRAALQAAVIVTMGAAHGE